MEAFICKGMNKYFGKYDTCCERSRTILRLKHSNYIKMQKWLLMVKSKNIKYSNLGLQYNFVFKLSQLYKTRSRSLDKESSSMPHFSRVSKHTVIFDSLKSFE